MVARHAGIRMASPSQEDLEKRREHCSVDPRKLLELGADVGSQVRILTTADDQVLYTVSEARAEDPNSIVRIGQTGRLRFGTDDEFDGVIDSQVPHPTLSDDDAEDLGEFVERLHDGASAAVIAIAPHGGDIELNTDRQAEHVASRLAAHGASSWICKGWKSGDRAFESWHITSDETDPGSFPLLASVVSRGFADAVSFHGFKEPIVLVGGLAPVELREEIRQAIDDATGPEIVVRVGHTRRPVQRGQPVQHREPVDEGRRQRRPDRAEPDRSRGALGRDRRSRRRCVRGPAAASPSVVGRSCPRPPRASPTAGAAIHEGRGSLAIVAVRH